MSNSNLSPKAGRPSLDAMLAKFLASELADPVASTEATATEVQPFLSSGFRVPDPRLAFREGTFAATLLLSAPEAAEFADGWMQDVPDWPSIVRQQQPILALPMGLGNFPQLVQDLAPLFEGVKGLQTAPVLGRALETGSLAAWGREKLEGSNWAGACFAAAALRLAGQLEGAAALLTDLRARVPAAWLGLLRNEEAVLAWHAGRRDEASKLWVGLPDRANAAPRFNLGLARLCAGQNADAEALFKLAASELPEKSAWHALANLYRTLATMG